MANINKKHLLIVLGPTAVGKTRLCVRLAKALETDVISADSRQFFKELSIGTAKPTMKELEGVKHHFIDNKSIKEDYNVGDYEKEVISFLEQGFLQKDVYLLTGGSGLYIDALCYGMDPMPVVDQSIRQYLMELYQNEGLVTLQNLLAKKDPVYHAEVDLNNPQRIIRALEVVLTSQRPFSSFRKKKAKKRFFNIIKIGLQRDRAELYQRIDQRVEDMLSKGLMQEVQQVLSYKDKNALQTIAYKEAFDFLEGRYDEAEMIRLIKRNTRRYAKRQMTWFGRDPEINWFHPEEWDLIRDFIQAKINF